MGSKQRYRADKRAAQQAKQNLSVKFSVSDDPEEEGVEVVIDDDPLDQDRAGLGEENEGVSIEIDDSADEQHVVDDEPEEDADEKATKILKRQLDEMKARAEASERRASEEGQRVKDAELQLQQRTKEREEYEFKNQERVQEYETKLRRNAEAELASHKAILEQSYRLEEIRLNDAKRRYQAALETGDYGTIADIQVEISRSVKSMDTYAEGYHGLEEQEKALASSIAEPAAKREAVREVQPAQQAQAQGDQFEAALRDMHPAVAAWAREHKNDILKPERQRLAFAADNMAVAKGMAPGSDEYLDFMDENMGYIEPEEKVEPAPSPKPNERRVSKRPTAAPVSRATSSSQPTKIWLNDWDRQQAKDLGYTEEYYAKNFKAKQSNGQLTQDQAGGRLMARYTA